MPENSGIHDAGRREDVPQSPNKNPKKARAARERMLAERAAQEKRSRRNRAIAIAVAAVVVVGGGVGAAVGLAGNGSKPSAQASSGKLVVPAHASGQNGTTVVYGNPGSKNTLQLYEDFRCPVCDALEKSSGPTIQKLADNGTYKIEYHMGTFLDGNLGGTGSLNALAAAGAALNESPQMFKAFHDVLYANQPSSEQDDAFANTSHLLQLAGKVPGLKTPTFVKQVTDGTYKPWAQKVSDAFNSSGVNATPTAILDGKKLAVVGSGGPVGSSAFSALIQQNLGTAK